LYYYYYIFGFAKIVVPLLNLLIEVNTKLYKKKFCLIQ